ncbi:hypothetical protein FC17_GL001617 [Secundilactobacillus paracollinoides DSM 15502 = JCM 11969]|nr:hypothetical protein FC17_GL001617 [Secundilactobacillus paracollinoides DSM 15502 = JCM 11969]
MAQFGTESWCRHQLATVFWSVTDVRDDEDPLESHAVEIELASSRATTRSAKLRNATDFSTKSFFRKKTKKDASTDKRLRRLGS